MGWSSYHGGGLRTLLRGRGRSANGVRLAQARGFNALLAGVMLDLDVLVAAFLSSSTTVAVGTHMATISQVDGESVWIAFLITSLRAPTCSSSS